VRPGRGFPLRCAVNLSTDPGQLLEALHPASVNRPSADQILFDQLVQSCLCFFSGRTDVACGCGASQEGQLCSGDHEQHANPYQAMKEHRQKEAPWRGPREASKGSESVFGRLVGSEPANRAPHKGGNSEVLNEVIRGRAKTRHEESMLKQRAASLAKSGP
jgi:CDGSH-type Zn-finger protein